MIINIKKIKKNEEKNKSNEANVAVETLAGLAELFAVGIGDGNVAQYGEIAALAVVDGVVPGQGCEAEAAGVDGGDVADAVAAAQVVHEPSAAAHRRLHDEARRVVEAFGAQLHHRFHALLACPHQVSVYFLYQSIQFHSFLVQSISIQ